MDDAEKKQMINSFEKSIDMAVASGTATYLGGLWAGILAPPAAFLTKLLVRKTVENKEQIQETTKTIAKTSWEYGKIGAEKSAEAASFAVSKGSEAATAAAAVAAQKASDALSAAKEYHGQFTSNAPPDATPPGYWTTFSNWWTGRSKI